MNNRIFWRDFVQTRAYRFAQFLLRRFGFELVIKFDGQNRATDVYPQKVGG